MSNESIEIPKSAPHITSSMSKNRLMQFTFFAILAVTVVSAALWSSITTPSGWNLGVTVAICALIAVGVAVLVDFLIGKVASDSEVNTWSAAVFGLIVTDCFSLGSPLMNTEVGLPVEAPLAFFYVALISVIGLVVFKKLMGLAGRKLVNPAAAAKFLVLLPTLPATLIAVDHLKTGLLQVPALAGPLGWGSTPLSGNGGSAFSYYLGSCFSSPNVMLTDVTANDLLSTMVLAKFHGWVGGASSLAVIIAGIALFVLARKYIKWKITVSYLVSIAALSLIMATVYADQDLLIRLIFEVFIGSSIFLAFFMATDPATTPYGGVGQIIFGVGLAVLTILIQTYMNFFGGSLLALLIMNLTVPLIDRIRIGKPFGR
jgi:Na+-translocating ferredoxin:NAD+ oxidoreductase RnfD subunit